MDLIFVIVVLVIVMVVRGIVVVPQGYEYTLEAFGKYICSFTAGMLKGSLAEGRQSKGLSK